MAVEMIGGPRLNPNRFANGAMSAASRRATTNSLIR
jgi:hypothetical protein